MRQTLEAGFLEPALDAGFFAVVDGGFADARDAGLLAPPAALEAGLLDVPAALDGGFEAAFEGGFEAALEAGLACDTFKLIFIDLHQC